MNKESVLNRLGNPTLAQPYRLGTGSSRSSVGPAARGQAGGVGASGYQHTAAGGSQRMDESAVSGNIVMQFSEEPN